MPAHGIGTACFVVRQGDKECIIRIHNCLLCHGEDKFNLLSVSQVLRTKKNEIIFSSDNSRLEIQDGNEIGAKQIFGLKESEGLYEMTVSPLYVDDLRLGTLPCIDVTADDDPLLWREKELTKGRSDMKAPTKLGIWHCKVLWMSVKMGLEMPAVREGYESHLKEFCDSYIAPPSQPTAKRTYRSGEVDDMAQLSVIALHGSRDGPSYSNSKTI